MTYVALFVALWNKVLPNVFIVYVLPLTEYYMTQTKMCFIGASLVKIVGQSLLKQRNLEIVG